MQVSITDDHKEPRLVESERIPALPTSPIGPYNKPANWQSTAGVVHKAIEAAYIATSIGSRQAVRYAHRLHDQAYAAMVNTADVEPSSQFDFPINHPGRRARAARIEWVRAKPLQPKSSIRSSVSILPFRWLTEQGHRYFQHLMQTLCKVPKKIDGEDFVDYYDQLGNEVPGYIDADINAKDFHQELLLLIESVLSDQATQSLNDTRPVAFALFRAWEDKLQKVVS